MHYAAVDNRYKEEARNAFSFIHGKSLDVDHVPAQVSLQERAASGEPVASVSIAHQTCVILMALE